MNRIRWMLGVLALLSAGAAGARAQVEGPVAPPPKFEAKRIPSAPKAAAPPIPAEEIIRRFTQNENLFKRAYDTYGFEQTARVQEQGDESGPRGEYSVTGEVYVKTDGKRYERITKPPVSTLRRTAFSLEDVKTLANLPLFVLTTDELPNYTLTYEGQEKLDELNAYIFRVKPKRVERKRRLFDGVIWVDDHDFAIVKSYGQFVTEVTGDGTELPFKIFETYRENFEQKYWFPTYIRSEDLIAAPENRELQLWLVIHSTNFHVLPAAGTVATGPDGPALPKPPQSPES